MFKEKEYLEKLEYQQELKQRIEDFILLFEGRPEGQTDLTRFHKFNEKRDRLLEILSTGQNKKTNEKENHGDREEKESMVFGAFLFFIIVCNEE